ncbi:MAG: DUF2157 domain-containing protein [Rhodocyclaceae bacterium]|nr:DUF2157 domain-containing protein [Rhodocyclaceae bacterium]
MPYSSSSTLVATSAAIVILSADMNRDQLDHFATRVPLLRDAVEESLRFTGLTPSPSDWHTFINAILRWVGVAALSAGAIFFIAANWQDFGLAGRFVLLQAAFIICIGVAMWRPSARLIAAPSLAVAFMLAGGMLALFGQSYQTGADLYELFVSWAGIALVLAAASRSPIVWALWWTVLNVGLGLFCGLHARGELAGWLVSLGIKPKLAAMLILPFAVNLFGALLLQHLHARRSSLVAVQWLVRLLFAAAFVYGVWAGVLVISEHLGERYNAAPKGSAVAFWFLLVGMVLTVVLTVLRRRDVFPLMVVSGAAIVLSSVAIGASIRQADAGLFFLIATWVIISTAAASIGLMALHRTWRADALPDASEGVHE